MTTDLVRAMRQRPLLLVFTVIGLAWFLMNLPLLLGVRVLPGDSMFEFYPTVYFNVHAIREGLAPWWNPYVFGGYPQIADPQGMLFAPGLMAWMLTRSSPGMTWFIWGTLLHVLAGGWATAAVLTRLRCNAIGATLGALVFMGGGVAASRLQHTPIVLAYGFLPILMLCLLRFAEQPRVGRMLCVAAAAACMVAQPVQLTYLSAPFLLAFSVVLGIRRWHGFTPRDRVGYVAGLAVAGLLALAYCAPQLVLSYAFVAVSNRPQLPIEAASNMSASWGSFLTLLLPNALHNLRGSYAGPADRIETFFWVGALPLVMLLLGWRRAWAHPCHRRYLVMFAVLGIAATLYMVGAHTPLYAWLYDTVPGVRQFRRPSDAAYLLNVALAFAAGIAGSHVHLEDTKRLRIVLAATAAWLFCASLDMRGAPDHWQAATIIAPLVAVVAVWRARRPLSQHGMLWLSAAVMVADFRCFGLNGEFNQHGNRVAKAMRSPGMRFLTDKLAAHGEHDLPPRIEAFDIPAAWKNTVMLDGISATHGYGPLRWALWDRWYGPFDTGDGPRPTTPYNLNPGSHLNQLLGVAYVVTQTGKDAVAPEPGQSVVYTDKRITIKQLEDAAPRIFSPTSAVTMDTARDIDADVFQATDLRRTLLVTPRDGAEREQVAQAVRLCGSGTAAQIDDASRTHVSINMDYTARDAAWIVITEPDFPGWVASVDGKPIPHYRADGLVRAVCAPAGTHRLSYRFEPKRMVREVLKHAERWR
jgi:hypothetical protein